MSWFILRDRRFEGPFSKEELIKSIQKGELSKRDFVIDAELKESQPHAYILVADLFEGESEIFEKFEKPKRTNLNTSTNQDEEIKNDFIAGSSVLDLFEERFEEESSQILNINHIKKAESIKAQKTEEKVNEMNVTRSERQEEQLERIKNVSTLKSRPAFVYIAVPVLLLFVSAYFLVGVGEDTFAVKPDLQAEASEKTENKVRPVKIRSNPPKSTLWGGLEKNKSLELPPSEQERERDILAADSYEADRRREELAERRRLEERVERADAKKLDELRRAEEDEELIDPNFEGLFEDGERAPATIDEDLEYDQDYEEEEYEDEYYEDSPQDDY